MKIIGMLRTKRKNDNVVVTTLYIEREFDEFHLTDERYTCLGNVSEAIYIGTAPCNANIGDRKLTMDYLSRETLSVFAKNNIEIPFDQLDLHVKTLEKDEFIKQLRNGLFNKKDDSQLAEKLENDSSERLLTKS